jgi:hypothetical protein
MAEPDHVARCIAAMAQASPLPVTVKHRIGIDDRDSYAELLSFVDTVAAAGAQRFSVHARKAWLEGLDPKQNRTIPPLRYDLVHQLKQERPQLSIELNGGLLELAACQQQLQWVDGVMVGRAAYDHPLRWAPVDRELFGDASHGPVLASSVVRGLIPYAENARTHSPSQVAQIAASIAEFGFVNPVLVDAEGVLIAGHGRVMAAKQLGLASVPVLRLGHLSPASAHALELLANLLLLLTELVHLLLLTRRRRGLAHLHELFHGFGDALHEPIA